MRKDDVTYLFERPFRNPRSEHYWSSLFAMFLLRLAREERPPAIPTWQLHYDPPHWSYAEYRRLEPTGMTWDGVFVAPDPRELLKHISGGRLRPAQEKILGHHLGDARRTGPDLAVFRPEHAPQVILLEVKTTDARLEPDTVLRYRKAEQMLADDLGLSAAFMLVCSVGHTRTAGIDEREISRAAVELILWDQVLEMMGRDPVFSGLLPPDVLAYTNAPRECPCPRPAPDVEAPIDDAVARMRSGA